MTKTMVAPTEKSKYGFRAPHVRAAADKILAVLDSAEEALSTASVVERAKLRTYDQTVYNILKKLEQHGVIERLSQPHQYMVWQKKGKGFRHPQCNCPGYCFIHNNLAESLLPTAGLRSAASKMREVTHQGLVVQVEDYRIPKSKPSGTRLDSKRRREIAAELGLVAQALCAAGDTVEAEKFYPMLCKDELKVWTTFLPKAYSRGRGHWQHYLFDVVPLEVLEQIRTADSLDLFDDLEIWTPEGMTDPIAVGLVGSRTQLHSRWNEVGIDSHWSEGGTAGVFLICRWGESLKSFAQIKREVRRGRSGF